MDLLEPVRISLYCSAWDNESQLLEYTRQGLIETLTTHDVTPCSPCPGGNACKHKNGPAFSPGVVPTGGIRGNENVEEVSLIIFDLDEVTDEQVEALEPQLAPYAHLIYSTHSHREKSPKLRLVLFPSRPIKNSEWRTVWHAAAKRFGVEDSRDKKAKDESRLYYLPSVPAEAEAEKVALFEQGELVDVDELIASYRPEHPTKNVSATSQMPPPEKNLGDVDMDKLRQVLRYYSNTENPKATEVIHRIYRQEPLAEYHDRNDSVHLASSVLAWLVGNDAHEEAVMELIRPSVLAMDGPSDEDFMEVARKSYNKARQRLLAAREEERKFTEARHRLFGRTTPSPGGKEGESGSEEDPPAWMAKLCMDPNRNIPTSDGANIETVLTDSDEWKNVLRYNEVTKKVEVHGGPALEDQGAASDEKTTAVNNWIRRAWDISVPDHVTRAQIALVAKKNTYNPLKDYLRSLAWDGTSRVEVALERYFGVISSDMEYVRAVSKKWFIALVARAMRPGCKMDNVLILEGAQGIKKSTALKVLGGAYFIECHLDVTNKDTKITASCNWLIELPELTAMRKSDTEALKAFFSTDKDQFRPPYGVSNQEFPRQSVFVGTTNADEYFDDDTGNRRYWPVRCGEIDIEALKGDRDQLFAEAVALFDAGESWWFDKQQEKSVEARTEKRLRVNANNLEIIRAWWNKLPMKYRPERLELAEVISEVLKVAPDRVSHAMRVDAGRCLSRLGFQRVRYDERGIRCTAYEATDELRNMKHIKGSRLTLINGAKPSEATVDEKQPEQETE